MAHCTRMKTVFSSALGGTVKRCAKLSGLSGLGKSMKKRKAKKHGKLAGLTAVGAYNKKCGCMKQNGRLKKGFRFAPGGRCVKAKG